MADDSDIRAVLREHGIDVPERGRLAAHHRAEYKRITGQPDTGQAGPEDAWDGPDDEGDVVTGTVPGPPGSGPAGAADGQVPGERRPARPRAPRPGLAGRLRGKAGKPKPHGKAKPVPRVPVDRLVSRAWETAARLFATVSQPVARTLQLQSPVAGLIFEDMIRETIVDRVLQPVARAEERAEKTLALAGPPLIVMAIERAQGLEEPRRQMQMAILEPMLIESLTMWVKIAGDKMDIARARVEASQEIRETVERMVAAIFPEPEPEPGAAQDAAPRDMTAADLHSAMRAANRL